MVALSQLDTERLFFHMGMGNRQGIDVADVARVERASQSIPSDFIKRQIIDLLDECDYLYSASKPSNTVSRFSQKEIYSGDINRAVERETVRDIRYWEELYLNACNKLANILWIPCYWNLGMERYRFSADAGVYIQALTGHADTSIASSKIEYQDLCGFCGYNL